MQTPNPYERPDIEERTRMAEVPEPPKRLHTCFTALVIFAIALMAAVVLLAPLILALYN